MTINHDTRSAVIAYYPPGAGGKFLINCLALSRGAVMQHSWLAQQQLAGRIDPEFKLRLLLRRLDRCQHQTRRWTDLDLGDVQLYRTTQYFSEPARFHPVMYELSHGVLLFFSVAHSLAVLQGLIDIWRQARVIQFQDTEDFVAWIRPGQPQDTVREHTPLQRAWNRLRGADWPESPPQNMQQYLALPDWLLREDRDVHQSWIHRTVQSQEHVMQYLQQQRLTWNCSWFRDSDATAHNIAQLYESLGLDDFDPDSVVCYHRAWIDCLQSLRDQ